MSCVHTSARGRVAQAAMAMGKHGVVCLSQECPVLQLTEHEYLVVGEVALFEFAFPEAGSALETPLGVCGLVFQHAPVLVGLLSMLSSNAVGALQKCCLHTACEDDELG